MSTPLAKVALEQLFLNARTHSHWQARSVTKETLVQLYDLLKLCPTSANCSPGRFVFITSPESRDRLKSCLAEGNVEKTMSAPVTVIVAQDRFFYESLPFLFPHTDAKLWFEGNPDLIENTAFRNSTLQGAYLIMAARSLGLDCGPMSGFDADALNAKFFPDGRWRANFLINLGYGEETKLFPRSPRFAFDEVCQIL